jgi:hypothetical protein
MYVCLSMHTILVNHILLIENVEVHDANMMHYVQMLITNKQNSR